jgi:hypothetical protein
MVRMRFAVVLALGLIGAIALIVFVTAKRRLSTWLIVGAVCMIGIGGVAWSHEHRTTTLWTDTVRFGPGPQDHTTIAGTHPVSSHSATVEFIAGDATQTTGAGNHAPAIALFAVGSVMGASALIMIRRRRARSAPSH